MPFPATGVIPVEWEGRRVAAADPPALADRAIALPEALVRRSERAAAAVAQAGEAASGAFEVAGRFLLRGEGLASSAIEGLRADPTAVAIAATDPSRRSGEDVPAWVADNLAVIADALADPGPVERARLWSWHARLMAHAPGIDPTHVGRWRAVLGWVGGANPIVAAHVAAPPDRIDAAMADLVGFVARDDVDPVTQAAVAHAQFETIHPFADGNGRIGRVLVAWILAHRLDVAVPPPLSPRIARDVGGYLSGLTLYRQGQLEPWLSWFCDVVTDAAAANAETLRLVADLEQRWRSEVADLRRDAAARRLVDHLVAHPVVHAGIAADVLGASASAARVALAELSRRGILTPVAAPPGGTGRPRAWFAADDLLQLVRP